MRLGEVRACACGVCAAIAVSLAAPAVAAPVAAAPPTAAAPPAAAPRDDAPLPPLSEARPPLPPALEAQPVPWHEHIEVGGGVAFVEMPASVATVSAAGAVQPTPVRFKPSVGFHLDLSWQLLRYLRVTGYLVEHQTTLVLPAGSFNVPSPFTGSAVDGYTFGVRASPTLPIGSRVRLWITGGWGFHYLGYGRFAEPTDPAALNPTPTLPARSATFFEIPVGVGGAITLVPRWLSLHFEMTGSFIPSQIGDAICQSGAPQGSCGPQYIDSRGMSATAGAMPRLDAVFVQTLGLSLYL